MNLLTDIIRDVVNEMGIKDLPQEQLLELQEEILGVIVQRVSYRKQGQVLSVQFPWLDKPRPIAI